MTTSTAGWASTSHAKELERLTQLLWHYETVNQDQKVQLDTLVSSRDNLINRIQTHEHEKKKQQKQIRSLELQLKYEKAASEGLRKKTGTLEKDLMDLKENFEKSVNHETDMTQRKTTIEQELKEERAYRLQLVHEKEKLQEEVNRLSTELQKTERLNEDASLKVLDLQQALETANVRTVRHEKLIKVQSDEIISLNAELLGVKDRYMGKTRDLLEEQRNHADYHFTMDKMQEEISFLRKELTVHAADHSDRNISSSVNQRKSNSQNITTKIVNAKTAKRYAVSHFRDDGTFTKHKSLDEPSSSLLSTSQSSSKLLMLTHQPNLSQSSNHSRQSSSPFSPTRSWISETFPQSSVDSSVSAHSHSLHSNGQQPSSKKGKRSAGMTGNRLTPLATRDRPRDAFDYAQPRGIGVDEETQSYFNNPDRVAFLQWIRTASRQASRQRTQQANGNHESNSYKNESTNNHMQNRVNEMKNAYQSSSPTGKPSASLLSSQPTAAPSSLQAFAQELKQSSTSYR